VNKDIFEGKWDQMKGKIQQQWGKLTDDDFDVADGNRDYLCGRLQERYGWDRERAEDEINTFERAVKPDYM
jgi:uncharacterized protein YjbJ (UPF0337 family)